MKELKVRTEKPMLRQPGDHLPLTTLQAIKGVENFVRGSEVDIRLASDFSKKHWEIYSKMVEDHVEDHIDETSTDDVYRLPGRLLNATGDHLLKLRKYEKLFLCRGYKPSDILVVALCRAVQNIGPPEEEPDDSSGYWLQGKPIWGFEHPISEA
jgi:hypothetical protein